MSRRTALQDTALSYRRDEGVTTILIDTRSKDVMQLLVDGAIGRDDVAIVDRGEGRLSLSYREKIEKQEGASSEAGEATATAGKGKGKGKGKGST